jgi:hypothetical protein
VSNEPKKYAYYPEGLQESSFGNYVKYDQYLKLKSELASVIDDNIDLQNQIYGLLEVLKQINKDEITSIRPGGSHSSSARISYEALKKFGVMK